MRPVRQEMTRSEIEKMLETVTPDLRSYVLSINFEEGFLRADRMPEDYKAQIIDFYCNGKDPAPTLPPEQLSLNELKLKQYILITRADALKELIGVVDQPVAAVLTRRREEVLQDILRYEMTFVGMNQYRSDVVN